MDSLLTATVLNSVGQFIADAHFIGILILAIAFAIRGELTILISAYLASQKYISWPAVFLTAFWGIFITDGALYFLGRFAKNTRLGPLIENKFPALEKIKNYIHKNTAKVIVLAKFTIGLTTVTMISSGWFRIDPRKFFSIQLVAVGAWTIIMGSISYLLVRGLGYLQASQVLDKIEWGVLAAVVLIFAGEYLLQRSLRSRKQ